MVDGRSSGRRLGGDDDDVVKVDDRRSYGVDGYGKYGNHGINREESSRERLGHGGRSDVSHAISSPNRGKRA